MALNYLLRSSNNSIPSDQSEQNSGENDGRTKFRRFPPSPLVSLDLPLCSWCLFTVVLLLLVQHLDYSSPASPSSSVGRIKLNMNLNISLGIGFPFKCAPQLLLFFVPRVLDIPPSSSLATLHLSGSLLIIYYTALVFSGVTFYSSHLLHSPPLLLLLSA